jgi:hypothetical protein
MSSLGITKHVSSNPDQPGTLTALWDSVEASPSDDQNILDEFIKICTS